MDISPRLRRGRKDITLRFQGSRADNRVMSPVWRHRRAGSSRENQRGQTVVEFALILPIFLLLVGGIIKFGIALNFWLDMQRIANQGARWAVVDAYPNCPRSSVAGTDACAAPGAFQTFLSQQKLANGEVIQPYICFESASGSGGTVPTAGDPVRVQITRQFPLGIPFLNFGTVTLHARATMRTEWDPTVYTPDATICP
jgi:hypothetical protein